MGTRNIVNGAGYLGCYYSTNTCNPIFPAVLNPSSNSTFWTSSTQFSVYYPNLYFVGVARFIFGYDSTSTYTGNFDLTSIALSGTSFQNNFVFSGNLDQHFNIGYYYLSLE